MSGGGAASAGGNAAVTGGAQSQTVNINVTIVDPPAQTADEPRPRGATNQVSDPPLGRSRGQRGARAADRPTQVFPPAPSSAGKRYYAFLPRPNTEWEEGLIAVGQDTALRLLGGQWLGHRYGASPRGFPSLEEAINFFWNTTSSEGVFIQWR